jgi:hypothetical protein
MYREEEGVIAEHAADVEAELSKVLAPRLALARLWEPRLWHWLVALVLWTLGFWSSSDSAGFPSGWAASSVEHPELFFLAAGLTLLATLLVLALFCGAMELAARRRANKILGPFGPPDGRLLAGERLAELKRRLANARFYFERSLPFEEGASRADPP